MLRRWSWLICLLVLACGLAAAEGPGLTKPKPLTIINNQVFKPQRQPPVAFRHDKHEAARIACNACHHDYVRGRNRWQEGDPVQPCAACHKMVVAAGKPDLKNAYHRQCKDCHLRRVKERQTAGPVQCRGCHRLL